MKETRLDSEEDELLRENSRIYENAIETCRKAMQHKEVPKRKATKKLAELIESIKKKEASMSEEDKWMQMYVMGYNDAISDAVEWLETTFEIMTRLHLSSEVIDRFEKDLRKKDL